MAKEEYDYELRKAHNKISKNEVECTIADGKTEREKYLEQRCEEIEYEFRNKLDSERNTNNAIIEQQQKEIEFYKEIIKGILRIR